MDCFSEGFGERSFLKQGYRDSAVQFQHNYFSILLMSDTIFFCSVDEFAMSFSRSRKLAVWFVSVSSACIVSKQGKLRSNVRLTEDWTQFRQHSGDNPLSKFSVSRWHPHSIRDCVYGALLLYRAYYCWMWSSAKALSLLSNVEPCDCIEPVCTSCC